MYAKLCIIYWYCMTVYSETVIVSQKAVQCNNHCSYYHKQNHSQPQSRPSNTTTYIVCIHIRVHRSHNTLTCLLVLSGESAVSMAVVTNNNNNTQKAAIASPPSATHPQLWAELHTHVHVSIQECTLSHLHLHPQVHSHASTHTLHAATDA